MTEYMKTLRHDEAADDAGTLHRTEGTLEEQKELKPVPTPPNEEEPYTLTAYGDISLSDIDYVPGPPSEISPSQVTKKESWRRLPRKDSESMVRHSRFFFDLGHSTHILNSRGVFRVSRTEFGHLCSQKDGSRQWRRLTSW